MPSLLSPRRTTPELALHATSAQPEPPSPETANPITPPFGWPVAAVVGGLLTALASWILCAGLAVVGWLAADPGTLGQALIVGTRLWLLSNGVSAPVGSIAVTLIPWGATAVTAFMLSRFAAFSARQVRPDQTTGPAVISVVLTATYLVPVLVVAVWHGSRGRSPLHWAAVITVLALAAAWGSSRALGQGLTESWPAWTRPLPRAILAAQLVLLVAGAGVLVTGLVVHLDRVTQLQEALDPTIAGRHRVVDGPAGGGPECHRLGGLVRPGLRLRPRRRFGRRSGRDGVGHPAGDSAARCPALSRPGQPVELWWLAAGAHGGRRGGLGDGSIPAAETIRHQQPDRRARRAARGSHVRRPGLGRQRATWATCAWLVWVRGWCRCW
jgi:hypothetical protein